MFYKNKKVLVTGGTGLVGKQLVNLLLENGADITIASLDDPKRAPKNVNFYQIDLRYFENCLKVCKNQDIVFHLAGIKGSPAMAKEKPASFFVPTITFSINMMEAARKMEVSRFLFTSSVGVYSPAEIFFENDVWKTFPSPNDKFAGWAKRICELQAEAYKIEYGWDKISIVRPANIYGPYDNFDPRNAMVIPSLINRALKENPLIVWGDGSPIRDFIHSRDVARGMMIAVEKSINEPINLGSGEGFTIKEIAEIIVKNIPNKKIDIDWDITKPKGDKKRIMDVEKAKSYGIESKISIEEGIKETINWYINNKNNIDNRYNVFNEKQ
tara:strand:+ start:7617 stop:8597 length:981 start_codon:yes stop_codon:yes gene_type:complete